MNTIIYTDGSSRGNPGPGGWGAVVITDESVVELGARDGMTTNNRMELSAAIEALTVAPASGSMILFTDSQYVIKGMTEWIGGWIAKGWKNSQKKPVINRDLWERLLRVSEGKNITWKYVRGHGDTVGNVRCDEIATRCADGDNVELYKGPRGKYPLQSIFSSAGI